MSHPTELDQLLRTLAITRHAIEDRTNVIRVVSTEKHLTMLNGIALFFIANPTNDVCAVSITQSQVGSQRTITFWIALNAGFTKKEEDHARFITNIATNVRRGEEFLDCFKELFDGIVVYCIKKINRRRTKLFKRFLKLQEEAKVEFTFATPNDPAIVQHFNTYAEPKHPPSVLTWAAWLKNWFNESVSRNLEANDRAIFLINTAYEISSSDLLATLKDEKLQTYLSKLAQYQKTINKMLDLAVREKGDVQFVTKMVSKSFTTSTFQPVTLMMVLLLDPISGCGIHRSLLTSTHNSQQARP